MKDCKKLVKHRTSKMTFLLILQIIWFLLFFVKLVHYSALIRIAFVVLTLLTLLHLIYKDNNIPFRIVWTAIIITYPLLGAFAYMLFSNSNPLQKLTERLKLQHQKLEPLLQQDEQVMEEVAQVNQDYAQLFRYIHNTSAYPVYKNTSAAYYEVGDTMYTAMLPEIDKAEHFILVEFFIVEESEIWDVVLQKLIKKAEQGVQIRILYDDMGCLVHLPPSYPAYLEGLSHNIKCAAFNPHHTYLTYISNARDHRKILVIDGHTAFSGGMNLADEYINKKVKYGHWKDNGVMLKGEAVWSFTAMFLELWNASYAMTEQADQFKPQTYNPKAFAEEGYIQPFGDTPFDKHAVGKNVYMEILKKAKHYVYIFTPYLIIDYEMKSALSSAADRGVDVRIVTPGIPDKKIVFQITRSNYAVLLKAGVKIYEYTPGFLHSKSYLCDDEIAVVGSVNTDYLSFYLEFECAVLMYKTSAIMELKQDYLQTFDKSRQITLADL